MTIVRYYFNKNYKSTSHTKHKIYEENTKYYYIYLYKKFNLHFKFV